MSAATDHRQDPTIAGTWRRPNQWSPGPQIRLGRLARSPKQLIEAVGAFGERGIGLRSLTEAIDTTTAGGTLVFHIVAALTELERGVIRERWAICSPGPTLPH